MRVWVYIDGFNFYHGAVRKLGALKWVDLELLARNLLLSQFDKPILICKVKYFTAKSKGKEKKWRQKQYFQAIKKYNSVQIIFGSFQRREKTVRTKQGELVRGSVFEEKGSDVNLGAHLVYDACQDGNEYDLALIISNDSDLREAVSLAKRTKYRKTIVIAPPLVTKGRKLSTTLKKAADKCIVIRKEDILRKSQLPQNIPDTNLKNPWGN